MNWSPKPLEFAPGLWRALMHDLWERGNEQREAGAFLVAPRQQPHVVRHWIPYDQIDPDAHRQLYVKLEPTAFSRLSALCSRFDVQVLSDIHTHPHAPVQSESDREHPMLSIPGHIALIVPNFARDMVSPFDVSFNVYRGAGEWFSCFGAQAAALIVAPVGDS